jgi:NDP-sugar pyrophosphorylase family protein
MERLVAAGATRIIVNTHHHADQIGAFLEREAPPDVTVALSPEPDGPYDTGGGLLAAAPLFRRDGPFLLHNVDVLSRIPLEDLLAEHASAQQDTEGKIVASLAVQDRNAHRQLLFDANGLMGWENKGEDGTVLDSRLVREPVGDLVRRSFTGIHVVEPAIFGLANQTGTFSIITWYLELAERGYRVAPVDMSRYEWLDVGTHERLAEARKAVGR